VPARIGHSVVVTEPADDGDRSGPDVQFWLVTFRRVLWSLGAVLVEASSESEARQIVRRERPATADRAKIRPAPPALVLAAQGKAPLSRGTMPILR